MREIWAMSILHDHYIRFVDRYLGARENMANPLAYLRSTPEMIDVHIGELNAAINRFRRLKNTGVTEYPDLLVNTEYLIDNLDTEDLPPWQEVANELISSTPESPSANVHLVFEELRTSFEFIDIEDSSMKLLGTLFMALYRTYVLVTRPSLRAKRVQIASSLEEMLALLAIDGCHTQLFEAVKHWILDFENEGFSRELAHKVADLQRN